MWHNCVIFGYMTQISLENFANIRFFALKIVLISEQKKLSQSSLFGQIVTWLALNCSTSITMTFLIHGEKLVKFTTQWSYLRQFLKWNAPPPPHNIVPASDGISKRGSGEYSSLSSPVLPRAATTTSNENNRPLSITSSSSLRDRTRSFRSSQYSMEMYENLAEVKEANEERKNSNPYAGAWFQKEF